MAVDERARLHRKLEEVLGPDEARTLMSELGSRGVTREDLREELRGSESRMDAKLQLLEARMDAKLATLETRMLERMNDQTRTFVRTFYVSNSALVLAVATLAFGAARLA